MATDRGGLTDRAAGRPVPPRSAGRIEARHLTFRYPRRRTTCARRRVVRLPSRADASPSSGRPGSGKSTLVNLLPRLTEPPPGTLFVDGIDVRDLPLGRASRRASAWSPQEPFLFSDTIGGNIVVRPRRRDGATGRRARRSRAAAAPRRGSTATSTRFPRATTRRRRAGHHAVGRAEAARGARARARHRSAHPHPRRRAVGGGHGDGGAILRSLRDVRRSRTCVIVAHRVSTVRDADLILVLADGRVVERGTHDALVRAGGVYAEMHRAAAARGRAAAPEAT